jgi:hypothetical protein
MGLVEHRDLDLGSSSATPLSRSAMSAKKR